jgi:FAD/FMN-containing dehydrogenase
MDCPRHTPFAGSANIQSGITIDLSLLNDVEVSDDRSTVRIGVGNRWGAVNDVLDPLDLATPGGRISGVGVGGFTSGGTLGFLARHELG